jgi:hypothetical protein
MDTGRLTGKWFQEKFLKQVDKNFNGETEFLSHLVKLKSLVGQEGGAKMSRGSVLETGNETRNVHSRVVWL